MMQADGHRIDHPDPDPDKPRVSFSSSPRPGPALITLDRNRRHEPAIPSLRPRKAALERRWCTSTLLARQAVSLRLWLMARSWTGSLSNPCPPGYSALTSRSCWSPWPLKRACWRARWKHCWRCLVGSPQREECSRVAKGLVPLAELTWYNSCMSSRDCECSISKVRKQAHSGAGTRPACGSRQRHHRADH